MKDCAGLYVHVPFCRGKCAYCGFYSTVQESWIPAYVEAMLREADRFRDRFGPFDTLHLGGGTPSLLSPNVLQRLVRGLHERFSFAVDIELTLEVNPEDVSRESVSVWLDEHINRVSVGVQCLDDPLLEILGRRHTAGRALAALETLRRGGCHNLTVDLMWGLPGQDLSRWWKTLEEVLAFRPEHISCYELTLEPGTRLAGLVRTGRVQLLDEEAAREWFEKTSDFLQEKGYLHYEISNYARSETWVSRHNTKYWRHVPYLGLGPGAHSFDGRRRWANVRSVSRYVTSLRDGTPCVEFIEELSPEQKRLEQLLLGFRTREGVPLDVAVCGEATARVVHTMEAEGLVRRHNGFLTPTRHGWLVADHLPFLFS